MAEQPPELSQNMRRLADAVRAHPGKVRAAYFGFDLWLEVMGSEHLGLLNFRPGGLVADGSEPEGTLIVPVQVIGGKIVVGFDPTLAPDAFELRADREAG